MAQIKKRAAGQWRARIRRKGFPEQSGTFASKPEAEAWAREIEGKLDKGVVVDTREAGRTTLKEALERYRTEISSKKLGKQPEKSRINTLIKSPLAGRSLISLRGSDLAEWRDARLAGVTIDELIAAREDGLEPDEIQPTRRKVGPNSVRLEFAVISHLYTIAATEWKMEGLPNPVASVSRPKLPQGRDRRLRDAEKKGQKGEEERLLEAAPSPLREAIILSIETAMRRGELCTLDRDQVDRKNKIAHLDRTKNGDARDVPLSPRALEAIKALPAQINGKLIGFGADWYSHAFADLVEELKLPDLHLHDLRHEATSRLFEKGLNIMEVAAITGHKTLQMLKRYTHPKAKDLAKKLA